MKINAIRALIIASLVIIILYTLGLFLPIITNTKSSTIQHLFDIKIISVLNKKITSL
tara:strand:+ start:29 stop:199 length:171 start_codon:yes stop_codon:yes gene_type:complete